MNKLKKNLKSKNYKENSEFSLVKKYKLNQNQTKQNKTKKIKNPKTQNHLTLA